jgi:hypothetical protein
MAFLFMLAVVCTGMYWIFRINGMSVVAGIAIMSIPVIVSIVVQTAKIIKR